MSFTRNSSSYDHDFIFDKVNVTINTTLVSTRESTTTIERGEGEVKISHFIGYIEQILVKLYEPWHYI